MLLWRIASDTADYEADELRGTGGERTGGRWNQVGQRVIYASTAIALACLETVVHLNARGLPLNRFLVAIEVPEEIQARRSISDVRSLAVGWSAIPEGHVSKAHRSAWIRSASSSLLLVPPLIVREEWNALINPVHPDAARIKASKRRPWFYDGRLR